MHDVMRKLEKKLLHYINSNEINHTEGLNVKPICIACSGGVDSMFLTFFLSKIIKDRKIIALIVDHNLQKNSGDVTRGTFEIVKAWGVESVILEWQHDEVASGVEEKARNARYSLMADYCKKNKITSLIVAHHIDDKIETFFMNSMRGTGLQGLTSMQEFSKINGITIFRPMINLMEKTQIIEFMRTQNIPWFEDSTNSEAIFTRNKIRHSFKFTHEQKNGILKTIKNLEDELLDKKKISQKSGIN